MRTLLRAALALVLLAGIYVVALILVGLGLSLIVSGLISPGQGVQLVQSFSFVVNMAMLAIPAILAILTGLFSLSGATGRVKDSVPLRPEDAPALWQAVTELAGAVGTEPPAELRVVAAANAEVTEETRLLGLLVGTRRLYVGMPLLLGLTVDELRAVLCHELGHYARRDTRIGALTYRGAAALEEMREHLRHPPGRLRANILAPVFWRVFAGYASVYLRLSLAMRRGQETRADAASVAVAGPAATADALRSVHALAAAWQAFLAQYVSTVRAEGFVPDGIFDGFTDMLGDTLFQDVLATWRQSPVEKARSPYDSHPSLAARLRAIESGGGGPGERDLRPACGMLAQPGRLQRAVQDLVFPPDPEGPPALPWPEWADLAAEALAVSAAEELLDATRRVAFEPAPTLSTVLDLLESGAADRLAAEVAAGAGPGAAGAGPGPGTDPLAARHRLRATLAALVGCVLTQSGYASWRLCWTGPSTLTGLDIAVVEFPALVDAAVRSPAQVANLREQLAYLGVPASVPLAPVRISVPGSPDTPAASLVRQLGGRAGAIPAGTEIASARPNYSLPLRLGWLGVCLVIGALTLSQQLRSDSGSYSEPYAPLSTAPLSTAPPWARAPSLDPLPTARLTPPPLAPALLLPTVKLTLPTALPTVVVRAGDTLSAIACRYQTTAATLQSLNNLGTSTIIQPGQVLRIPYASWDLVAAGETAAGTGCQ